jgi:hypothetical protein
MKKFLSQFKSPRFCILFLPIVVLLIPLALLALIELLMAAGIKFLEVSSEWLDAAGWWYAKRTTHPLIDFAKGRKRR